MTSSTAKESVCIGLHSRINTQSKRSSITSSSKMSNSSKYKVLSDSRDTSKDPTKIPEILVEERFVEHKGLSHSHMMEPGKHTIPGESEIRLMTNAKPGCNRNIMCLAAFCLLVAGMASLKAFWKQQDFRTVSQSTNANQPNQSGVLVDQTPSRIKNTSSRPTLGITVESYRDYLWQSTLNSRRHSIDLSLHLRDNLDWPPNAVLVNPENILGLRFGGQMDLGQIFQILNQTQNVHYLEFRNVELCDSSHLLDKSLRGPLISNKIRVLKFRNLTECLELYKAIVEKLPLEFLDTVVIKWCTITDRNLSLIQSIFESNLNITTKLILAKRNRKYI